MFRTILGDKLFHKLSQCNIGKRSFLRGSKLQSFCCSKFLLRFLLFTPPLFFSVFLSL